MHQQQYQQQMPINLEPGGMIGIFASTPKPATSSLPKFFLFFAGILAGLAIGVAGAMLAADRQISEAKDTAKLEQLQRQKLQTQINNFCRENGNGR